MSNSNTTAAQAQQQQVRWIVIVAIALVAFFASYQYAVARGSSAAASSASPSSASPIGLAQTGGGGGGCCGGGAGGPKVSKQADVVGGVQKIAVDLSSGSYNPSEIVLKAGIPAEITYGQGSGCLSQVQSQDLGFFEDLTAGPKTVKIQALTAGTYTFTCGMQMVSGTIVVK